MKYKSYLLFVIALMSISCNNKSHQGSSSFSISTKENAHKYIAGKTFLSTPSGDLWFKIVFTENTYTLYTGVPQYEGWREQHSGNYIIEENRYTNTGKKYYYVTLGNDNNINCQRFDITGMMIYSCLGYYDSGSRVKESDKNPWN